jgi:cysteine desulfurase
MTTATHVCDMPDDPIYLDYQATTPLDGRVLEAMLPYLTTAFGNPHATSHHGRVARKAVEEARWQVAKLIGADAGEVIFTSGATEANNMLIRGGAAAGKAAHRSGIVTTSIEHKAVLDVVDRLTRTGHRARLIAVDHDGFVDEAELAATVDDTTALVTIIAANNEVGVVQPLAKLAAVAHGRGSLFHTDAAQAVGKIELDVKALGIDLMSLSAHKLYGPMGIGAAYIARAVQRRIEPLIQGGGQEGGLRSGTIPVPLCVGFGEACRIASLALGEDAVHQTRCRDLFLSILTGEGVGYAVNGSLSKRLPGNLNISFLGVDAEALLMRVRDHMSIASGSACTAESLDPSHVILAMGLGEDRAEEAVRIGFGRPTTEAEVVRAAQIIVKAVAGLGRVSYRRVAEG